MNKIPLAYLKITVVSMLLLCSCGSLAKSSSSPAKSQVIPMLAQVPSYDEQALTAKLLANAVNQQEALEHQQNVLTLRQLEAQNKHSTVLLEHEKIALERAKLVLEQQRLAQQQTQELQQYERTQKYQSLKQKPHKQRSLYQKVSDIRLASILSSSSGQLKAVFYLDDRRITYLEGDQMFTGAQLIEVAANGVAIKLNEEVIFKYIN